jgi:predicted MFS family arabinose efflux permease
VVPLSHLVARRDVLLSWTMTFLVMAAGFLLIPNLSAFVQYNLGYPRARLGVLYLCGGCVSFVATQLAGRLVDRFGSFRVGTAGAALLILTIATGFLITPPLLPVVALFVAFMLSLAFRNVAYNTLTSKVPQGSERARFMSIQSAVQHAASASGAFLSARMLSELTGGMLAGMGRVAATSIALTLALPLMLFLVESGVHRRMAMAPAAHVPQ